MREYTLYIWIGVWLFILPFLGFPGSWKETLIVLTAFFIVAHTLFIYWQKRKGEDMKAVSSPAPTFDELTPHDKGPTV